jgi:hypothetical protein
MLPFVVSLSNYERPFDNPSTSADRARAKGIL